MAYGTKPSGLIIKGGLKIEGCKVEGLLYSSSQNICKIMQSHIIRVGFTNLDVPVCEFMPNPQSFITDYIGPSILQSPI